MLSGRIFPTFPFEFNSSDVSCLAYGLDGAIAFSSGPIVNFAFLSDHNPKISKSKFKNQISKHIKMMFSISIGLNKVTALTFDTKNFLPSDHLLYIGDIEANIYIYDYHNHIFLTVFSPNSNFKENNYSSISQISVYNYRSSHSNILNKGNKSSIFFRNIVVLFESRQIVSYTILKEKGQNSNETTVDHRNYFNSFYFFQNNSSSFNLLSSFSFSVNWELKLDSSFSSFSIDPFSNLRIFLYNHNKDSSFAIIRLVSNNGQMKPMIIKSTSLDQYCLNNQTTSYTMIQTAQFSHHFCGYVFVLTEHKLYLYDIQQDLFTLIKINHLTSPKSSHFSKILQFESDEKKLLLVFKTGTMALLSFDHIIHSNFSMKFISTQSSSAVLSLQNIELSNSVANTESGLNSDLVSTQCEKISYVVTNEIKHVIPSQVFIDCINLPYENFIVILYKPFGLALFDLSSLRVFSCCPYFCDKTTCFSTNDQFVAYGTTLGDVRIRSIFDNTTFYSFHAFNNPIKYINLSLTDSYITVLFGNDQKIGAFSFKDRKLAFRKQPKSFQIMKIRGSPFGGLIIQRFPTSISVVINSNETFLSVPDNDEIVDFCLDNLSSNSHEGSFMILRKSNVVELMKYNQYTKYSFNDNNYNCSNSHFLNSDNMPYVMKRRIITQLNSSPTKNKPDVLAVTSLCIAFSRNDYALGFNDGSVLLLKTNDQTFAKQVEVRNSTPIVTMKYCENENNKVLFCLTLDGILCELTFMNDVVNSKLTLFHVSAFTIINSSFLMVKNSSNGQLKPSSNLIEELIFPFPVISKYKPNDDTPISLKENHKNRNADSSYSIFEKSLSFPSTKTRIRNCIINHNTKTDSFSVLTPFARDFWMILTKKSSMKLNFLYAAGDNSLEYEAIVSQIIEAASLNCTKIANENIERKYSMELFYSMIYAHRYDEATNALLYNPESPYFLENTLLATVLLGFTEFNASIAPNQRLKNPQQSHNEQSLNDTQNDHSSIHKQNSIEKNQLPQIDSEQHDNQNNSFENSQSENSENDNQINLTQNNSFEIEQQPTDNSQSLDQQQTENSQSLDSNFAELSNEFVLSLNLENSINQNDLNENDLFLSNSEDVFSLDDDPIPDNNSLPNFSVEDLLDESQQQNDVSLSSKEQQYAMIKHAATQLMMLSNETEKFTQGVNLLRIAQLDSFAVSILIQSNKIHLALRFIRGMIYPEKQFWLIDIAIKLHKTKRFNEAALFFLSGDEYLLALHSFFLFAKHYSSKGKGTFNVNYSSLICDVYFLKTYMVKCGLLKEPFDFDETMKKKCYGKIGNKQKLNPSSLIELIDHEFKKQLKILNVNAVL